MLPLGLFRRPTFSAAASIGLLLNIAFYGLIFVLSLFFQRQQGHSALETGLLFAPMTAVVLAANIAAGHLARVIGPKRVILLGSLLAAVACAALLNAGQHTPYAAMVTQLVTLGASIGLIVPVMTSELLGSVERSRSGIASGTLNTMRQTGSVVGVALFGSLLNGSVSDIAGGLHVALLISVGLLGAIGLFAQAMGKTTT
jgi:DHA2 family methylenomycin A resistance protein-like MFS transporter